MRASVIGTPVRCRDETAARRQRVGHHQRGHIQGAAARIRHADLNLIDRGQIQHAARDKALVGAGAWRGQGGKRQLVRDSGRSIAAANFSAHQRDRTIGGATGLEAHAQLKGASAASGNLCGKGPTGSEGTRDVASGRAYANQLNIGSSARQLGRDHAGDHHVPTRGVGNTRATVVHLHHRPVATVDHREVCAERNAKRRRSGEGRLHRRDGQNDRQERQQNAR